MKCFFGFLLFPLFLCGAYDQSAKQRMVADLEIIKNEFEINYAPAEWKSTCYNWNLENEIAIAREKILTTHPLTDRGYQQIIRDLFSSVRDLHVSVNFYTTEFAMMPFMVQGTEDGRCFIVWRSGNSQFAVGDEILAFDDVPVKSIVDEIQLKNFGPADSESFRKLSEIQLTIRDGNSLDMIPQGIVKIDYLKKGSGAKKTTFVEWDYLPEEICNNYILTVPSKKLLGSHPFFHRKRMLPAYEKTLAYGNIYGKVLGANKSFFPELGEILWKSSSNLFQAYIFSSGGKSIGYVRIPDFHGNAHDIEEFRSIIAVMEKKTQALVVDLMNNPGGYSFYAFAIASLLTDKPLTNLKERSTITQGDLFFALGDAEDLSGISTNAEAVDLLGEDICGFPVDMRTAFAFRDYAQFVKEQFQKGHTLTDLYPLEGLTLIYPHKTTHYSKPLYILANHLSISCADLLPALLQDNKRAKIVGCRTAGAGGYVLGKSYSNRFGVAELGLTGSIAYRFDNTPLENRGVEPDFNYHFTAEDYTNDYVEFSQYLNRLFK